MRGKRLVYVRAYDHASFVDAQPSELRGRDYIHVVGWLWDEDEHYYYIVSAYYSNEDGVEYDRLSGLKVLKAAVVELVPLSRLEGVLRDEVLKKA